MLEVTPGNFLGGTIHLTTPIVLSYGGTAPPTLEIGTFLGTPQSGSGFHNISVIGRYAYDS